MTKAEKRAEIQAAEDWRETRLDVYTRDRGFCRAFRVAVVFEGEYAPTRSHCHHILFRSQGGTDEPSNLATLSQRAHAMIHDTGELTVEGDANGTLTFTQTDLNTGRTVNTWESPNPSEARR